MLPPRTLERSIERCVREEWGRILASLVKSVGDFQLAEDCLQEAVLVAMEKWAADGMPNSPAGWLISVARRKAIDRLRRSANFASKQGEISYLMDLENAADDESVEVIADKRLEMIFTCCHPALEEKTRVALTLRTLGGLSTDEIAAAFLDKSDAMSARVTRAKKKIATAGIPYRVPEPEDLAERLGSVLKVIYLIFNEGYWPRSGDMALRRDLSDEAIRLGRIVRELMPAETEVTGLLALMLLNDARRDARVGASGEAVALETQNRARWSKSKILEGVALLTEVLPKGRVGPFQLQAAISAVHGQATTWEDTDWAEIAALYEVLYRVQPTSVVRLNQAVAVSYAVSVERALAMLDELALEAYQPYWAARADLLARLGDKAGARDCYGCAIELSASEHEVTFLRAKLDQL